MKTHIDIQSKVACLEKIAKANPGRQLRKKMVWAN